MLKRRGYTVQKGRGYILNSRHFSGCVRELYKSTEIQYALDRRGQGHILNSRHFDLVNA